MTPRAARKTPVLTVYGIPGRDCGQYSSGNPLTSAGSTAPGSSQIAKGLLNQHAMVVLEPDALPLFSSSCEACPTMPDGLAGDAAVRRQALSPAAARGSTSTRATRTGRRTTPGRSSSRPPGIQYARGFSTNVSNFRPTSDEKSYAAFLMKGLRKLGVEGKHYVIDTSRNGATPGSDGHDVINPTWARLGKRPKLVFHGAFDGTLWVKHPGESDGPVNGGTPSGQWCDFLADRLLKGDSSRATAPSDPVATYAVNPDADAQNAYLERHSWDEYAAWHLGLTEGANDETKARYAFGFGDLRRVHRSGLIACVYRASEWRHKKVELAAHDLLQLLPHGRLRLAGEGAHQPVVPGPPLNRPTTRDVIQPP